MAEIEIQRKERGAWPWIVGLLVLALVIWGIAEFRDDETRVADVDTQVEPGALTTPQEPADGAAGTLPQPVQEYLTTCAVNAPAGGDDMGRQHEYTVDCLRRLAQSFDAVLERNQQSDENVSRTLEEFRSSVQQLEGSGPQQTEHANLTRDAATRAVAALERARSQFYGTHSEVETSLTRAREAAQSIRPGTALLEQRDQVHTFFREAGSALRAMALSARAGA